MARCLPIFAILALAAGMTLIPLGDPGSAQEAGFTASFLNDPDNIALGKTIWAKRCRFCHGKTAYPGSAPQLKPWHYKPEFIYNRITDGFRGMPALKQEFSETERRAIVAYVLSDKFSP